MLSFQVSLEDMAFDDLILGSVQSVTKAATSLISAATAAQKVLVAQGKMSGGGKKVKCPFSLSISLSILHTTGQGGQPMVPGLSFCGYSCCLCHWLPVRGCQHSNTGGKLRLKTLNDGGLLQEGTDGNVLAATAKQVSKSTIQLVLACQVLFCLVRRTFVIKDFRGIRADKR